MVQHGKLTTLIHNRQIEQAIALFVWLVLSVFLACLSVVLYVCSVVGWFGIKYVI